MVVPIAWSNDDMPELGGETTLEQCLYEAKLAGFSGVEFGGKLPLEFWKNYYLNLKKKI